MLTSFIDILIRWLAPLMNPLVAVALALLIPPLVRRTRNGWARAAAVAWPALLCGAAYHLAALNGTEAAWLAVLDTPFAAVFLLVVWPAMVLPRNRWYKLFLLVPAAGVAWFALSVAAAGRGAPPDFHGILVRPGALAAGLASALVLVQPLLSLGKFRIVVRIALLFVLTCGGFALRQNYQDYQEMLARRKNATPVMNLSETTPVLRSDTQLVHLPAAPCRFAPDGGYVQGCNLELAQRFLQTDYRKVAAHDPGEVNTLGLLLGSLLVFVVFSFLAARWFCGWLCPLSTMGDFLNFVRRKLGLAPWRPGPRVKWGMFFSGAGLLSLAGAMAAATPFLDAQGRFAGCKIPIFPFCKLCPNQQLCPMAGTGPAAYPPLPTPEWGFGIFRYGCLVILLLFALCFIASRRLWCWFCPMGMVSGLFNRGGLFKLRKDAAKCNRCGVCAEVCPMSLEHIPGEMKDADVGRYGCVLCLRCVEKCPRDGCLALEHNGTNVVESKFKV